jgi:hypothetical protein
MKTDEYTDTDNLEDLAAIAWNRAIIQKQLITVRCPEPEGFVSAMLQITAGTADLSKLSIQEFTNFFDRAKLVEDSELQLEKSDTYSYFIRK